MNKTEFLNLMVKNNGITKKEAEKSLKMVLAGIEEVIENKEEVNFIGFGSFSVRERIERKGTNPRTKEKMIIPAYKSVYFKAGQPLKEKANK